MRILKSLNIYKIIFVLSLVSSFVLTELYYSSGFSPDFYTYSTYLDFNFNTTNKTGHGHGHLYYYLVSFFIFLKSNLISDLNIYSILNSSIQLTNFILYLLGLLGTYLIIIKNNITKNSAFLAMSIINFFPATIIMRIWMKPEILAFAFLPWVILNFDEYLKKKNIYSLIFTFIPLSLILQAKGSIFGMVSVFLFLMYVRKLSYLKKEIFLILIIFCFIFGILYFENYQLNNIHIFDHNALNPDDYNNRASVEFLYHLNKWDFYYFPIFGYHNNSFIGITLFDTFGDYFNLSFKSDKSYFSYSRLQVSTGSFINLYSREYAGVFFTIILYLILIWNVLKDKKFRVYYIAPFIGMTILLMNAFGFPSNNFDPNKGDTLKSHYYSFLLTITFLLLFSKLFDKKQILIKFFGVLVFLTSIFVIGFPKVENNNLNFYLQDKSSFTNLCIITDAFFERESPCNKPITICNHNLYSESISYEIINSKKTKLISEENPLNLISNDGRTKEITNKQDCINKINEGYSLVNPFGEQLRLPPIVNLLYFLLTIINISIFSKIKKFLTITKISNEVAK